jgi:hypothetical protein
VSFDIAPVRAAAAVTAAHHHKEHFLSKSVSRQTTNDLPEPVIPIVELISSFPAPWALCGGWAVDAWLGRQTRDHADVDIAVFVQDQRALFQHLAGWQLVAHDRHAPPDAHEQWKGRRLELPGHIHGRRDLGEPLPERVDLAPEQGFTLDIQLGDRSGGDWVLRRRPRVSLSLRDCIQPSPWGLPTVVPEVLLFFKAFELRRRDNRDFQALLPCLTRERRDWLREAISRAGHPWLPELA